VEIPLGGAKDEHFFLAFIAHANDKKYITFPKNWVNISNKNTYRELMIL
jgi:hypothetical protein